MTGEGWAINESLWFACGNPLTMLDAIEHRLGGRKLRWYAVACLRSASPPAFTARHWTARHWEVVREVEDFIDADGRLPPFDRRLGILFEVFLTTDAFRAAQLTASFALGHRTANPYESRKLQCALLRDVAGNSFRPVAVDPSWLAATVVALAGGIYADRAFDRLPVLADALQDAGCDSPDILHHCRADGPHVRGCWVVDLLTGRT